MYFFIYLYFIIYITKVSQKLFIWFSDNQKKANHDKCYLLLSSVHRNFEAFK